ncbi:SusC/RagA family TonB-linked outer membrane protein [Chryseobacterium nematophagum]|uniref:SusC/RagA family TonB-linked outer membrane protein n=1 Tax=Chryseobacterium nematophagum TaxID=2305228 RepID=A0A3M7L7P7_9FLAO|nr:SusC/RagA family TonB-linked outer membrane protein [Chryseobacterium nematophagum]RMZ58209.1 SusC/RagA family TonB-linked outer membrane protein [Chryseobacterium nematophagum]
MKKLTTGVLILVLSSSIAVANAQQKKSDTVRTQDIEGVVVTAFGIKREKKSLGYATQEVKGDDINKNPTANLLNNLSGQVAGLDIKQSTNFGGSINVVLRGFKSFSGTNQPLFVIDGVPIINNNINSSSQATGRYGVDYGNAASDINPNDVETINVLKGATAAALYGSRAANGAIIITTKKGKKNQKGIGVEFSSSVTISSIDRTTFPKYQTEYGQGYYGQKFNGYGAYNGGLTANFGDDASYGPKYDPNLMVYQYGALTPGAEDYGRATPWVMAKNGPLTFFNDGTNYTNSISLNGGNDVATYRLSYTNLDATDIMPNSSLIKNNFGGNASYKITEKLTASMYANYITQKTKGRNDTGYNGNIMAGFRQWWPTNVDLRQQQALYGIANQNFTWNITGLDSNNQINEDTLKPQYWDNIYFLRYKNYQTDTRERFNGNFALSYDVSPELNLLLRLSNDSYTMTTEERKANGSVPNIFGLNINDTQPSGYSLGNYKFAERNYDFIATYKKDLIEDLNLNAVLGSNIRYNSAYSDQHTTVGGLNVPDYFDISNSKNRPLSQTTDTSKQVIGLFAQASLGYKNTYYVEGTIRRDQTSALAPGHDVYWYPSVSGSIVFSNLLKAPWLNFGKLRANYSIVGNDTDANQLIDTYLAGPPVGNLPIYSFNGIAKNPDLVAEKLKSMEFGLETTFFKNRIGFDASWYRNNSQNLISNVSVAYSTGSILQKQNIGNLRTEAFELSLKLTPIKLQNVSWDLVVNWSNPKTTVTELKSGVDNLALQTNTSQGGVTLNAPLGGLYGTIYGSDYIYSPDGQRVIDSGTGAYLKTTTTNNNLGSYQAKWFGGIRNTINYKNVSLSFLIDAKHGGKVFSLDQSYGYGTGLYPDSVGLNDLGNPVRNTLADGGGIVLPGVIQNPDGSYSINNVRLDKSQSSQVLNTDPPAAAFVYDASYVKLREASITYKLSKEVLGSKFIQGMSFSIVGSNLWIIHKNLPYADPEAGLSSGNLQGYQSGVMPTTRNFSFNVKVNF